MPTESIPLKDLENILSFEDEDETREFVVAYGLQIDDESDCIKFPKDRVIVEPQEPLKKRRADFLIESKNELSNSEIVRGRGNQFRSSKSMQKRQEFAEEKRRESAIAKEMMAAKRSQLLLSFSMILYDDLLKSYLKQYIVERVIQKSRILERLVSDLFVEHIRSIVLSVIFEKQDDYRKSRLLFSEKLFCQIANEISTEALFLIGGELKADKFYKKCLFRSVFAGIMEKYETIKKEKELIQQRRMIRLNCIKNIEITPITSSNTRRRESKLKSFIQVLYPLTKASAQSYDP